MNELLAEKLAEECRRYAEHLRIWTLSAEEIGEVRPLRELLADVAQALDPDWREQMRLGADEVYVQWARKIGEKYPWLHPDFDPASQAWQMRRRRAYRRMEKER